MGIKNRAQLFYACESTKGLVQPRIIEYPVVSSEPQFPSCILQNQIPELELASSFVDFLRTPFILGKVERNDSRLDMDRNIRVVKNHLPHRFRKGAANKDMVCCFKG